MRWIVLASMSAGCVVVVPGAGSEERDVGPFTAVSNDSRIDVDVVQGEEPALVLDCRPDRLDQIDTEVVEGELRIETWSAWYQSWGDCTATVTTPTMTALSVTGSGDAVTSGTWPELDALNLLGSG